MSKRVKFAEERYTLESKVINLQAKEVYYWMDTECCTLQLMDDTIRQLCKEKEKLEKKNKTLEERIGILEDKFTLLESYLEMKNL